MGRPGPASTPVGHRDAASRGWLPLAATRWRKGKAKARTAAAHRGLGQPECRRTSSMAGRKAGATERPRQASWGGGATQRPGQGHGPLPVQAGSVQATPLLWRGPLDYPMDERCCLQQPRPQSCSSQFADRKSMDECIIMSLRLVKSEVSSGRDNSQGYLWGRDLKEIGHHWARLSVSYLRLRGSRRGQRLVRRQPFCRLEFCRGR